MEKLISWEKELLISDFQRNDTRTKLLSETVLIIFSVPLFYHWVEFIYVIYCKILYSTDHNNIFICWELLFKNYAPQG